jgi:hypothetical protein
MDVISSGSNCVVCFVKDISDLEAKTWSVNLWFIIKQVTVIFKDTR